MRNGYQNPDDEVPDGDKVGKKKIGDELTIGKVEDWLGARLSVTPIAAKTNAITVDGSKETQYTIGNPNWLQFFVAGSIFKNVSIFIENEFTSGAFKFSWYYLGFHNVAGPAVNFQIGNVSPVNFSSYSNRLRAFPMVRNEAMRIKSSYAAAKTPATAASEDGLDVSSARPGIQYYGRGGPLVWWAGVSSGSKATDPNDQLHYWGGLRFEIIEAWESPLEGSSVSIFYQAGTDATNTKVAQITNDYYRIMPALNLRLEELNLDFQAGYVYGSEDNATLTAAPVEGRFEGWTALVAWTGGKWVPGIQWDRTNLREPPASALPATATLPAEMSRVTPVLSYMLRENMRVTAYAGFDLLGRTAAHPDKQHEFIINIRTMF